MSRRRSRNRGTAKFAGSFDNLRELVTLTGMDGGWEQMAGFWRFRCHGGAILNWWPSTGTVNLQGPSSEIEKIATAMRRVVGQSTISIQSGSSAVPIAITDGRANRKNEGKS